MWPYFQARLLRSLDQDPYAAKFERTHFSAALHEQHKDLEAGTAAELEQPVAVAGRVRAKRVMGKLAFIALEDDSGQIQLYIDKKQLDSASAGAFA